MSCDQRGWGVVGSTLDWKGYSAGASDVQNVRGGSAVNSMRTTDFGDLYPYFHGTTMRTGAPCCFGNAWP